MKKKKKVAGASSEFSSDFVFEGFEGQRVDKETEDLKKYLKKSASSTLDDKIAEVWLFFVFRARFLDQKAEKYGRSCGNFGK